MTAHVSLATELAEMTKAVLGQAAAGIENLNDEQLHYRASDDCNSIAFDAWHVARTADNLVHFAFEHDAPVWIQQGLNEAWKLPKSDQGTSMSPEEAHNLRFPDGKTLAKYCRDVSAAIAPRMAAMTNEYLAGSITIKPQGEMTRARIIGRVIIAHGAAHNGMINTQRTVLGVGGLGI